MAGMLTWKQTCGRPGSSKTWSVGMRSRMQRASLTEATCRASAAASSGAIAIAIAGAGGAPPLHIRQQTLRSADLPQERC